MRERPADDRETARQGERDQQHAADARFHSRLINPPAEREAAGRTAEDAVQCGQRTFVLHLQQEGFPRRLLLGLWVRRELQQAAVEPPLRHHPGTFVAPR